MSRRRFWRLNSLMAVTVALFCYVYDLNQNYAPVDVVEEKTPVVVAEPVAVEPLEPSHKLDEHGGNTVATTPAVSDEQAPIRLRRCNNSEPQVVVLSNRE